MLCYKAKQNEIDLMRRQLNLFRTSSPQCFGTSHVLNAVINNHENGDSSIWIATESTGTAGAHVKINPGGSGPPYPIQEMIIRDFLFWGR